MVSSVKSHFWVNAGLLIYLVLLHPAAAIVDDDDDNTNNGRTLLRKEDGEHDYLAPYELGKDIAKHEYIVQAQETHKKAHHANHEKHADHHKNTHTDAAHHDDHPLHKRHKRAERSRLFRRREIVALPRCSKDNYANGTWALTSSAKKNYVCCGWHGWGPERGRRPRGEADSQFCQDAKNLSTQRLNSLNSQSDRHATPWKYSVVEERTQRHSWPYFKFVPFRDNACDCATRSSTSSNPDQMLDIEKYEWKPSGCALEPFDAQRFCGRLNKRTLAVIGDSTSQQAGASLINMVVGGMPSSGIGCAPQIKVVSSDTLVHVDVPNFPVEKWTESPTTWLSHDAQLTVAFKPGKVGISADWKSGNVKTVDERKQAHLLGVRVGMRVLTVAGEPYTKARYVAAKEGAKSYEVTFAQAEVLTDINGANTAETAVEDARAIKTTKLLVDMAAAVDHGFDIVVLGGGAHFYNPVLYQKMLDKVVDAIQARRKKPNPPQFLWKTVSGAGCGKVNDGVTPLGTEQARHYHWTTFKRYDRMARQNMTEVNVPIVDMNMLYLRGDAHPRGDGGVADCLHFCTPGPVDVFAQVLSHMLS